MSTIREEYLRRLFVAAVASGRFALAIIPGQPIALYARIDVDLEGET